MTIRDEKTKQLFVKYLKEHSDERFMQAVRNFTLENLNKYSSFICSTSGDDYFEDTFDWECDMMLKEEE
jgi:hypothetical protein